MSFDEEWERYEGGPNSPFKERIHATLNERGAIYINSNLHMQMGRPTAVLLYYNRERDLIAIEPANPRLAESFPVRVKKNGAHWIYAWPFCRHHKIRFAASHKFLKPEVTPEGRVILDLKNTTPVFNARMLKAKKAKFSPRRHPPDIDYIIRDGKFDDADED